MLTFYVKGRSKVGLKIQPSVCWGEESGINAAMLICFLLPRVALAEKGRVE